MKKIMNFLIAFFVALGGMISFCPCSGKARKAIINNKNGVEFGIAQHFEHAWSFLATAVTTNGQK